MARRTALTAAIILICAVLQVSVMQWFALRGVEPDLLLVVTVVIALLSGPRAGMAVGFSAGVVEGALLGRFMGVYAAAKTIAGYLAGVAGRRLLAENLVVMVGAGAALTLVHDAIFDILVRPAGVGEMVGAALGRGLYCAGVAAVVGPALRRVRAALPPEEVRP